MLKKLKCIDSLFGDTLRGKKVLLRTDFNVPVNNSGRVTEDETFRIDRALPTIEYLIDAGAVVIIISHIGRGGKETLRPVFDYLGKKIRAGFVPHSQEDKIQDIITEAKNGSVIMLENLRANRGEQENDEKFAAQLAELADIYVNEAFSVSHRAHASIVGIPKLLPSYIGLNFREEIAYLSKFEKPAKPFGIILGGAKLKTKLPLLEKYIDLADWIIPGGGIANTLLADGGYEIGTSLYDDSVNTKKYGKSKKILLPEWYIVNESKETKKYDNIGPNDKILDIAPQSVNEWAGTLAGAKTILWNGPLGKYDEGFVEGSIALTKQIQKGTALSVAGGGDTVSFIYQHNFDSGFSFLSTGGGAMLAFLAGEELPGIIALLGK